VQGGILKGLAELQELRITTAKAVQVFTMHLEDLPPSLKRLEVSRRLRGYLTRGYSKLVIVAPPAAPPGCPDGDDAPATRAVAGCQAASSQSPAPAAPELVHIAVDYYETVLPASWPLAAPCAVSIRTGLLGLARSGEHATWVGLERDQVTVSGPAFGQMTHVVS